MAARNKLIDYSRVDELVKDYENLFLVDHSLDMDEEKLFLEVLKDRREVKYQNIRMKDSVSNMPLGGLFKKLTKTAMGKGDEE